MKSGTFHRTARMWMLYVVTLTKIFKVIKLLEIIYLISGKRWELAKNALSRTLFTLTLVIERANFVHRHPDILSRYHGNHRIFIVWKTVRASERCSSTTFIEADTSHRISPLRMLYIVTLTYIFKITKFLDIIFIVWKMKRAMHKYAPYDFYASWYSLSNCITANVVLNDLELNFQGQTFQFAILTSIGWKMQTLILLPKDRKSGIFHRMVPQQMLYIMTLTYIFKVTKFEMWIIGNGES